MAKWAHSDVLRGGAQHILTLAGTPSRVVQHLVKAYAAGDSYATVIANSVADADMAAADLTFSTIGTAEKFTIAAKNSLTATASSGANPDLHQVLVDSVGSAVLLATDETANEVVTIGGTVNLPSWSYTVSQPA